MTYLSLCNSAKSLYQLKPFVRAMGFLDIVQPGHSKLDKSLDGSFELAMFLTEKRHRRIQQSKIFGIVCVLGNGLNEKRSRLDIGGISSLFFKRKEFLQSILQFALLDKRLSLSNGDLHFLGEILFLLFLGGGHGSGLGLGRG